MLHQDRERAGLTIDGAARRLGLPPAIYRELEAGECWPGWEAYDRIAETFGWPRSFAREATGDS